MQRTIDEIEAVAQKSRPLILIAYSAGALNAHGVALRLPGRVRKLVIAAMRPDFTNIGRDVYDCDSPAAFRALPFDTQFERGITAWVNELLPFVKVPVDKWPAALRHSQNEPTPYGLDCFPVYPAVAKTVYGSDTPPPVAAPLFVLSSTGEAAKGERPERMDGWREMTTSGSCEFGTIDGVKHSMIFYPDKATKTCAAVDLIIEHLRAHSHCDP